VIGIIPGVENMPLQIRRGTEAERTAMTQPLAQGELLYVTNDQRLYIGNGSTLGGIQITGYTNEDAQDAAAQLFSNGTHTGITFTYNDASASISAALNLSNFAGTITADAFKGSVFGDDSTPMVDAINNTFNGSLSGNVTGNVTGNLTGNVTGNVVGNITGNLVGNITGNTTGYHTGDIKGSVFGDDSSILVDAVSGTLSGNLTTEFVQIPDSSLGISFVSNTSASFAASFHNGNYNTKTAIGTGVSMGAISIKGWNGSAYTFGGAVVASWEVGAVISDAAPLSTVTIASGAGGSSNKFASLDSKGIWLSPVAKTTVYSVAGTALPSAVTMGQGARAFVSDATSTTFAAAYAGSGANKVPVYSDGTVWRIG
jgi:hypothetical protein